jgi:hypothetical protein
MAAVLCVPASRADGAGGYTMTGLGEVGFRYTTFNGPASDDANSYFGSGSALWAGPDNLNFQGNYVFRSNRYDGPNTVDELRIGGGLFWRDPTDFAYGGELHYQSLDSGVENDGIALTARGEKYFDEGTIAAYLGYSDFGGAVLDASGWQLGAKGTFYSSPLVALKVGVDYGSWDFKAYDGTEWSFSGEAEYLLPAYGTSVYAGVGFGSLDPDGIDTTDQFNLGLGLRVHFGADSGDLKTTNRSEPLSPLPRTNFGF